ncbi:ABC transporter permease (plasmid) [Peteryoungia desertarenae]|uniref:ABC transporter permease n=1 Tax=Peteryoungia desertarenae TaxID=1813451 RepID=A0ABX6QSH0_9HYPH|nr:ABC transporter permease [Peteryoungia desertarenae]QLF71469.1 ABC transporter permease [Peteryoungia desertarenae]
MKSFSSRFLGNPRVAIGLAWLGIVLFVAVFAEFIRPGDPFAIVGKPFEIPGSAFLLGTDSLGRDVFTALLHGARTTLLIAVISTLAAVAFGTLVGALAGYYGGLVDDILMRLTEFFQTIPSFLFAIVLIAILSPSAMNLVIAIAVVSWPPITRVVRAEVLTVRSREFVQAAIVAGQKDGAVLLTQILPNTLSPLIVTGSLLVATAILVESALSFLGLGAPNQMSWGFMIGAGRSFLRDAWWLVTVPGVAILLTVLSINLVGEGLNDALNPRLADL